MSAVKDWNFDALFYSLNEKYGFDLTCYAVASLQRRLERFLVLHHFENVSLMTEKLLKDPVFFDVFVKEITVNTTEMFRDPGCWSIIRDELLPLLKEMPSIRIWHAGCSSGEEVYSMAILLKEEGLFDKTKIVATDINRQVIHTATEGIYPAKTMELNDENYRKSGGKFSLSDYYTHQGSSIKMNPALLENVRFLKHDLSTGVPFSKFDIIICRNVMIYFNKELQEKVFNIFNQSLFKKGFVVIGKKETMLYYSGYSVFSEQNAVEKIYRLK